MGNDVLNIRAEKCGIMDLISLFSDSPFDWDVILGRLWFLPWEEYEGLSFHCVAFGFAKGKSSALVGAYEARRKG